VRLLEAVAVGSVGVAASLADPVCVGPNEINYSRLYGMIIAVRRPTD